MAAMLGSLEGLSLERLALLGSWDFTEMIWPFLMFAAALVWKFLSMFLERRLAVASSERGPLRRSRGPGFDASPSVESGSGAKLNISMAKCKSTVWSNSWRL